MDKESRIPGPYKTVVRETGKAFHRVWQKRDTGEIRKGDSENWTDAIWIDLGLKAVG